MKDLEREKSRHPSLDDERARPDAGERPAAGLGLEPEGNGRVHRPAELMPLLAYAAYLHTRELRAGGRVAARPISRWSPFC